MGTGVNGTPLSDTPVFQRTRTIIVVYYESLMRELKTKAIYGFRCDESLKTKVEESTRLNNLPRGRGLGEVFLLTRKGG